MLGGRNDNSSLFGFGITVMMGSYIRKDAVPDVILHIDILN